MTFAPYKYKKSQFGTQKSPGKVKFAPYQNEYRQMGEGGRPLPHMEEFLHMGGTAPMLVMGWNS